MKLALRSLFKSPGYTAVAVTILALGIGASTAVFSLVNAILLQSLPVPHPHALRILHWSGTDVSLRSINQDYSETIGPRAFNESVNYPTFLQLREQAADLADVFGFFPLSNITAVTSRTALSVDGMMVTANFFTGIGVRPFIGRLFVPGDDAAARPNIVLSHAVWQNHFDADPAALGQTVTLHGMAYTVIGVLPRGFDGIRPGDAPGFYVSLSEGSPFLYVALAEDWHWFIRLMARVHPGTSDAQLGSALTAAFAANASDRLKDPRIEVKPGHGGLGFDRAAYGKPLLVMLGVTGLVLLVACANLAGLSLARGATRQQELAVRAALGASRWRLIGQSLAENGLLAAAGGGLGVLVALWIRSAISALLAGSPEGLRYDVSLDGRVLGFALAAAIATAVLSGLLPAWRAGRVDAIDGLKSRGAAGTPRLRAGKLLVAAQICVSLSVLAGAGLGLRTLLNLRRIHPGFHSENLVVFEVNPGSGGRHGPDLTRYYDRVQEALAALPGVTDAGLIDYPLLSGRRSIGGFRLTNNPELGPRARQTHRLTVNESFFQTLGIPLLDGRSFTVADSGDAPKVIVVNEAFVQKFGQGRRLIGETMTMWQAEWRIVGVVGNAKLSDLKSDAPPTTYFPFRQRFYGRYNDNALRLVAFTVRSPLPLSGLRPALVQAVASVDPNVPATAFTTQSILIDRSIAEERLLANLCGALAGVALLLCCIGLYGLIAYDVTRRRGEIAIRLAIGAQPRDVFRPILREAIALAAFGIGAGLPLALAGTRLIESQLYGISPLDPPTLVAVSVLLILVAVLAAWLPARRALRVNPADALRSE